MSFSTNESSARTRSAISRRGSTAAPKNRSKANGGPGTGPWGEKKIDVTTADKCHNCFAAPRVRPRRGPGVRVCQRFPKVSESGDRVTHRRRRACVLSRIGERGATRVGGLGRRLAAGPSAVRPDHHCQLGHRVPGDRACCGRRSVPPAAATFALCSLITASPATMARAAASTARATSAAASCCT